MATQHTAQKLLTLAGKFVVENKGEWDHDKWETFLADADKKLGVGPDDEVKRNLGNILEAAKYFYASCPATPKKKAAAKSKAKAKTKSR